MNTFSQISANVGVRVGDTSSLFSTIINGYVNQRYLRLFKKFNWPTIVPNYTLLSVAGQQDYELPSGFKSEVYIYDTANNRDLPRLDFEELERIFPIELGNQGTPIRYSIYQAMDTTSPSPLIQNYLRFYQIPTQAITYNIPYIQQGVNLVASTDLPIIDMSDLAAELGATADAWRTKRQFQKASDFEMQYEQVIMEMVWSIENNPNRVPQFRPRTYDVNELYW